MMLVVNMGHGVFHLVKAVFFPFQISFWADHVLSFQIEENQKKQQWLVHTCTSMVALVENEKRQPKRATKKGNEKGHPPLSKYWSMPFLTIATERLVRLVLYKIFVFKKITPFGKIRCHFPHCFSQVLHCTVIADGSMSPCFVDYHDNHAYILFCGIKVVIASQVTVTSIVSRASELSRN